MEQQLIAGSTEQRETKILITSLRRESANTSPMLGGAGRYGSRHRTGGGGAFTRKYRVHRLVYFRTFNSIGDAIARETEIKKWRREKKVALIEARNPTWEDLAEGWGEPTVMRVARTAGSSPGFEPGSE